MNFQTINDSIMVTFGQNLQKARKSKELSLRAFAELCGIDHGDISRIENGLANVTLKTIAHLANTLEVPYHTLLKP